MARTATAEKPVVEPETPEQTGQADVSLAPAVRAELQELADQLHGVAQDMGLTNPNRNPITFTTKERWGREIESVERRLRRLLEEG